MRTARLNVRGVVYHLIWRFVDRSWFFTNDDEREVYLRLFGHAMQGSDWRPLAYALMSNHVHHAIVAGDEPLAAWAKRVHSPFAHWMNRQRNRIGPMMADRPKDFAVLPENEGRLIAYIHNNPVRAKVVDHARASTWTSHRAYVGDAAVPRWLDVTGGLARAGFDDARRFDDWVRAAHDTRTEANLEELRRAVRKRGAIELGTPTLSDVRVRVPLAGRPFAHIRPDPRRVIEITAEVVAIPRMVICSRRRNPAVHAARRIAVHCGRALGLTGSDLASALGVSPQAVSRIALRALAAHERQRYRIVLERVQAELETRVA